MGKQRGGEWSGLVGGGENPNGATQVTPNGVAHETGDGMNHQYNWGASINGPRWEMPNEGGYGMGMVSPQKPAKPRPSGNRNRSGE